MKKPQYYVLTWDVEKGDWTPQAGVRKGPYSLFGLRRAIRALRGMGYSAHYRSGLFRDNDPSVLIERRD